MTDTTSTLNQACGAAWVDFARPKIAASMNSEENYPVDAASEAFNAGWDARGDVSQREIPSGTLSGSEDVEEFQKFCKQLYPEAQDETDAQACVLFDIWELHGLAFIKSALAEAAVLPREILDTKAELLLGRAYKAIAILMVSALKEAPPEDISYSQKVLDEIASDAACPKRDAQPAGESRQDHKLDYTAFEHAKEVFRLMEYLTLQGVSALREAIISYVTEIGEPKREICLVPVDDEDVEIAIAEAIAVIEPKTDYCEKGIPVLKYLKQYGWSVMQPKSDHIEGE